MAQNPVVHFEMPAKDMARVKKFYEEAFGWTMIQMGGEVGNYVMAQTSETEENGFPKEKGMINGGFFEYDDKKPGFQYPSVVISVPDIYKAAEQVRAAGGTVVGGLKPNEPDDIPGIGLYMAMIDPEGNRVGMLQAHPMQ